MVVWIAEPESDFGWGQGLRAKERQQAIVGSVARQVDEDVDLVGADLIGGLGVGQVGDAAPVVDVGTQLLGRCVGGGGWGIGEDLELSFVVVCEQRQEESVPTGW